MAAIVRLLLICLLLVPGAAGALDPEKAFGDYVRAYWGVAEGVPHSNVTSIAQDRDGSLWIGSQFGLSRFDGLHFHPLAPDEAAALPHPYVQALLPMPDGRLWIATSRGVAVRDHAGMRAVPAGVAGPSPEVDVRAFATGPGGKIWAASVSGVFAVDGERLVQIPGAPEKTYSLLWHDGALWVGARGSVWKLDRNGWTHQALPLHAPDWDAVVSLVVHDGALHALTSMELFRLDGGWHKLDVAEAAGHGLLRGLMPDSDGNLWLIADGGVGRIGDEALAEWTSGIEDVQLSTLWAAFEDREGNLWLGSASYGLTRLWNGWTRRFSAAAGLADRTVWAVAADPGTNALWVGTNSGLARLEDGRFTAVAPGEVEPGNPYISLHSREDAIWIGMGNGVYVMDRHGPRAGVVRRADAFSDVTDMVTGFAFDADGGMWVASYYGGVVHFDGGRVHAYGVEHGVPAGISELRLLRDGRPMITTRAGLFVQGPDGRFSALAGGALPSEAPLETFIELADGTIVAGATAGEIYFQHRGSWHRAGAAEGLDAGAVTRLLEIGDQLWAVAASGVLRVPRAQLAELAQGRRHRLDVQLVATEAGAAKGAPGGVCCNSGGNSDGVHVDGTIWVPTSDGVLAVDLDDIDGNAVPPNVVVERVETAGQWRDAAALDGIELAPALRDIGFAFSVLSLQDPRYNSAEYRLRGYDRDWRRAADQERLARYTNLPPGDYVFEVRGTNNWGVPAASPARFTLSITPWFHETPAFKVLLGAVVLALVLGLLRYQRRRHRRQQLVLEGLVRERTAELEASHRQLERVNLDLEQATLTDPLTGLRNRRYLGNQLPADLAYYDRRTRGGSDEPVLVFALIDVDHFKAVNDTHGHRAGDLVLQQVARVLADMVRSGDYVVRWGGEEFLLVFRPMPMEQLAMLGERIRAAIAGHCFDIGEGKTLRLTASTGMAEYPLFRDSDGASLGWESMVELADLAMYHVKTHGRNGWAAYRPTAATDVATVLAQLQADAAAVVASGGVERVGGESKTGVEP